MPWVRPVDIFDLTAVIMFFMCAWDGYMRPASLVIWRDIQVLLLWRKAQPFSGSILR